MTGRSRILLVGLTGGIATGKSTVSGMLRELGGEIIDADLLAREVVEPGQPALAQIATEFGPDVLTATGALDRKKLGAIIFANPDRRRRLEAITHPAIRDRFVARLGELIGKGFVGIVIYDAAVLIESGNHKNLDRLVGGWRGQHVGPQHRAQEGDHYLTMIGEAATRTAHELGGV